MKYYNLSLRQLKTILVVSEQKRLIKASEILSLTPPAVTIQLRQAEEEIATKTVRRLPGTSLPNLFPHALLYDSLE